MRNLRRNKLWISWHHMLERCNDPAHKQYPNYGLRGIKVCNRWHKFQSFVDDMGESYNFGMTIDRIDNDRGYHPANCKWSTRKEQANNRRSSRWIEINGSVKTLAQWIDESGLKPSTVKQRYYVYKWDISKSLGMGG